MNERPSDTWEDPLSLQERRPSSPRSHLFVVLLADHPTSSGARHALDGVDVVIVGRSDRLGSSRRVVDGISEMVVGVPARALSAQHARLHRRNGGWELEDAGSKNGTLVNGVPTMHARLEDGDVIEMGRTLFVLRIGLDTPHDARLDVEPEALSSVRAGLRTLLPALAAKHAMLTRLAPSKVPILLLGPTGAGKEVVARAVHDASARKGDFVAVNCGALPAALVEGLMFGHVRGAFSGALRDEKGFVRAAEGGTLLLDEIGDLPSGAQTTLLRMLQENEIVPLGATRPVKVDVRVIAATHRPIEALADAGDFRADLLARINGFMHRLPSLAERREDLGLLIAELMPQAAAHLGDAASIDIGVARAFVSYGWPLNIRELSQCLGTASMLATNAAITATDLPEGELARRARDAYRTASAEPVRRATSSHAPLPQSEETLRAALVEHLGSTGGNVSAVARAMGRAPFQIRRWLKRLGIDADAYRRV